MVLLMLHFKQYYSSSLPKIVSCLFCHPVTSCRVNTALGLFFHWHIWVVLNKYLPVLFYLHKLKLSRFGTSLFIFIHWLNMNSSLHLYFYQHFNNSVWYPALLSAGSIVLSHILPYSLQFWNLCFQLYSSSLGPCTDLQIAFWAPFIFHFTII